MTFTWELKLQLDKIIDQARKREPGFIEDKQLLKVKNYKLAFGANGSRLGYYSAKSHCLTSYKDDEGNNLTRCLTLLHLLAHHVDYSLNGITEINGRHIEHGVTFYKILKTLLYASFDTKTLSYDAVNSLVMKDLDYSKIRVMMKDYKYCAPDTKSTGKRIYVFESYAIKEELKKLHYTYNPEANAWYKNIRREELDQELQILKDLNIQNSCAWVQEEQQLLLLRSKTQELYLVLYKNYYTTVWAWHSLRSTSQAQKKCVIRKFATKEQCNNYIDTFLKTSHKLTPQELELKLKKDSVLLTKKV